MCPFIVVSGPVIMNGPTFCSLHPHCGGHPSLLRGMHCLLSSVATELVRRDLEAVHHSITGINESVFFEMPKAGQMISHHQTLHLRRGQFNQHCGTSNADVYKARRPESDRFPLSVYLRRPRIPYMWRFITVILSMLKASTKTTTQVLRT